MKKSTSENLKNKQFETYESLVLVKMIELLYLTEFESYERDIVIHINIIQIHMKLDPPLVSFLTKDLFPFSDLDLHLAWTQTAAELNPSLSGTLELISGLGSVIFILSSE